MTVPTPYSSASRGPWCKTSCEAPSAEPDTTQCLCPSHLHAARGGAHSGGWRGVGCARASRLLTVHTSSLWPPSFRDPNSPPRTPARSSRPCRPPEARADALPFGPSVSFCAGSPACASRMNPTSVRENAAARWGVGTPVPKPPPSAQTRVRGGSQPPRWTRRAGGRRARGRCICLRQASPSPVTSQRGVALISPVAPEMPPGFRSRRGRRPQNENEAVCR